MTTISKELFYKKIDESVKCYEIHFWNQDCLKANLSPGWLARVVVGAGKFFLPVYLVRLLINYKKIKNKKFLLSLLMSEIRSIIYGIIMASLIVSGVCSLRAIFGRLHYYNFLLLPGMLSGLSLFVESKENQILDTLIFFNSLVETIIKQANLSKGLEVLLFMSVSAFIMANFENRESKLSGIYFWFYSPSRIKSEDIPNQCDHSLTCPKFCWDGLQKYFAVGYALNILRTFLSKSKSLLKKPSVIYEVLLNIGNCKLGLFIGSYVGLYRAITCYFTRSRNIKPKKSSYLAGLLAGATYVIYPRVQILVIAITTMLQMMYDFISKKLKITNHFWQMWLLFTISQGYLLHCKFYYPKTCSPYYKNMIDACTDGVTKEMYDVLINKYF